jgi:hypothetical protein
VAQADSLRQALILMQRISALSPIDPRVETNRASDGPESALSVATVYQDPLTRYWATELWDRVGQLVGQEGLYRKCWKISDLTDPRVFMDSVRVAAEADVMVVSVRDTGELPISLYVWIDSWMPARAGRAGALVALIGMPPVPDTQAGRAHGYLEGVARRAGLDFLPHERKLPGQTLAVAGLAKPGLPVRRAALLAAKTVSSSPRAYWAGD